MDLPIFETPQKIEPNVPHHIFKKTKIVKKIGDLRVLITFVVGFFCCSELVINIRGCNIVFWNSYLKILL